MLSKPWKRKALWLLIGIWFVALVYLMFLYRIPTGRSRGIVVDPFYMYREAKSYNGLITNNQSLRQILFNALLYLPFGIIAIALSKRVWIAVVIGLALSILMEAMQFWTGLGWADVDDVISNGVGLLMGIITFKFFSKKPS